MNTLYEILEVSENASEEVIEKAYKVLAKKYHPDLQTPENKAISEAKMKEINEAYSVLSDDIKRKEYDEQLFRERQIKEKQFESQQYSESQTSNHETQPLQNQYYSKESTQEEQRYRDLQRRKYEEQLRKQQEQMRKQMEQNMQEQYENAYYNYLRSLGYKIKEKWTWKKTKQLLLTILIMVGIVAILWFFPPTHNMMVNFYESNKIVKIVVDIILGIIIAIFKAFESLFSTLFS